MPVLRRSGQQRGGAARPAAGGPRLESITPYYFTAADSSAPDGPSQAFRDHADVLYGLGGDGSWAAGMPVVSYHDMARAVARDLAERLDGIDLIISVEASADCRHQSFPACVLGDLVPGDPLVLGISEQGVAGPFTALRTAADMIAGGAARRALILILEQSTLPPGGPRPARDLAVALLVSGEGAGPVLGRPVVTVSGRFDAPQDAAVRPRPADPARRHPDPGRSARTLVLGAALADLAPAPGVAVSRAEPGHPCAGVWLALADLLADGKPLDGSVLIADRDPRLPYLCSMLISPSDEPAGRTDTHRFATVGGHAPEGRATT
ncbi:hypothetical protein [Actinocrinis sp.]|uniref:hypothetical protein n=1 Tax=Actinocrinis sp. TaxID=1920516 RepID=UPI002D245562|nr:hypothetical protein [Actinocrinis sp.]HZP50439.1 hypothetical protein [Actinocrinis sp.]